MLFNKIKEMLKRPKEILLKAVVGVSIAVSTLSISPLLSNSECNTFLEECNSINKNYVSQNQRTAEIKILKKYNLIDENNNEYFLAENKFYDNLLSPTNTYKDNNLTTENNSYDNLIINNLVNIKKGLVEIDPQYQEAQLTAAIGVNKDIQQEKANFIDITNDKEIESILPLIKSTIEYSENNSNGSLATTAYIDPEIKNKQVITVCSGLTAPTIKAHLGIKVQVGQKFTNEQCEQMDFKIIKEKTTSILNIIANEAKKHNANFDGKIPTSVVLGVVSSLWNTGENNMLKYQYVKATIAGDYENVSKLLLNKATVGGVPHKGLNNRSVQDSLITMMNIPMEKIFSQEQINSMQKHLIENNNQVDINKFLEENLNKFSNIGKYVMNSKKLNDSQKQHFIKTSKFEMTTLIKNGSKKSKKYLKVLEKTSKNKNLKGHLEKISLKLMQHNPIATVMIANAFDIITNKMTKNFYIKKNINKVVKFNHKVQNKRFLKMQNEFVRNYRKTNFQIK